MNYKVIANYKINFHKTIIKSKTISKYLILGLFFCNISSICLADFKTNVSIPECCQKSTTLADMVEKLTPAVVNISAVNKVSNKGNIVKHRTFRFTFPKNNFFEDFQDFFDRLDPFFNTPSRNQDRPEIITSVGSGFVISKDGKVVTNNHVVNGAKEVNITFYNNKSAHAKVIAADSYSDLAVLQINDVKEDLSYIEFGNSDKMRAGDSVIAIGNPFGLGGSVSSGIISAISRDINIGPVGEFIQTDAAINRGNSGGPLLNMYGEVIAINTAIYSTSGGNIGIGFAVTSNYVKPIIEKLIQGEKIERGWLGVKVQNISSDIAESIQKYKQYNYGVLVAEVTNNSPASKAGIRSGDVLLEFANKKINSANKLVRLVGGSKVGKKVVVKVLRKGKIVNTALELAKLPDKKVNDNSNDKAQGNDLGLTITELSRDMREEYNIAKEVKGVLVIEVVKNSSAFYKGLLPGDVIVSIDQNEVNSIKEFNKELVKAKKNKRRAVLLFINRSGNTIFVSLPIIK